MFVPRNSLLLFDNKTKRWERQQQLFLIFWLFILISCNQSDAIVREYTDPASISKLFNFSTRCDYTYAYRSPEYLALTSQESKGASISPILAKLKEKLPNSDKSWLQYSNKSQDHNVVFVDIEIQGQDGFYRLYNGVSFDGDPLRALGSYLLKMVDEIQINSVSYEFFPLTSEKTAHLKSIQFAEATVHDLIPGFATEKANASLLFQQYNKKSEHPDCGDTGDKRCYLLYSKNKFAYWDSKAAVFYPAWQVQFGVGNAENLFQGLIVLLGKDDVRYIDLIALATPLVGSLTALEDPKKTALKTISVQGMQNKGYLCSDSFVMSVPSSVSEAYNKELKFAFDPSSDQFAQTSIFAAASAQFEWAVSLGYRNWSNAQIVLRPYPEEGRSPEFVDPNIVHKGWVKAARAYINYPDTIGYLRNLHRDPAPIAHEFSHAILFEHVMITNDFDLKTIVEGIADALAELQLENPCMGSSVCDSRGTSCATKSCLRTAANTRKYMDSDYQADKNPSEGENPQYHSASQVVSGFFWDLHIKQKMSTRRVGELLLSAIRYMQPISSYKDLLRSVLQAEKDRFKNDYSCQIYEAAKDRGFASQLPSFNCRAK